MPAAWLYAAAGPRLAQYALDVEGAALAPRATLTLPAGVQYAWRHATLPLVYVACSDGGPGRHGTRHCVCVLRMDADGALAPFGEPVPLSQRPVHLCTDRDSRHLLLAYPSPSRLTVLRIARDGSLGADVAQPSLDLRKMVHQVVVAPSNDRVIVPIRGNDASAGKAEDPGSLEVYAFRDGVLAPLQSIAPDGGYGFGPRHVDFHPQRPWMYLGLERQNEIAHFVLGESVSGPLCRKTTLLHPEALKPRQLVGAVHVHPGGRFVYVSNRADGTVKDGGIDVFNGGENTISVFAIDPATGEPTRVQVEDTRGMHVRTFSIDPSGRILVAASMVARKAREGATVREVATGLSVFRIGDDGRLAFARKLDVATEGELLFWSGFLARP